MFGGSAGNAGSGVRVSSPTDDLGLTFSFPAAAAAAAPIGPSNRWHDPDDANDDDDL